MRHGVADDLAVKENFYASKIEPTLLSGKVDYIGNPDLTRDIWIEVLIQQIFLNWQRMFRVRCSLEFDYAFLKYLVPCGFLQVLFKNW